ncbi:DUF4145 domain-containing protein [Dyadobacter luticola]|uniref:DUF4145 domain-containing protein n=1 Tax=Dyadobacter luticola TaxID=1979387 RepID=A0A5R9KTE5_9BACT|nr:DUF4145 domain-containing protein [Dyadobacter luticola]TLU99575.1 DUF4145 domain-containing protein [Dyadobacter luticola]
MYIQDSQGEMIELNGLPDECPFCHNKITPISLSNRRHFRKIWVFMQCPSENCHETFIAYYEYVTASECWLFTRKTSIGNVITKKFNEQINGISPSFSTIYNEAYFAEQHDLLEICGVGYRKALEFLIKDYAKINHPGKELIIEGKLLAQCIGEFVADEKIKAVAKRAVWLGNDETHYVKKWQGKNLEDLKKLIDLTVHWIEMEELTKSFQLDMPD